MESKKSLTLSGRNAQDPLIVTSSVDVHFCCEATSSGVRSYLPASKL